MRAHSYIDYNYAMSVFTRSYHDIVMSMAVYMLCILLHIKPSMNTYVFLTLQTSNSSTFLLHELAKHPEVQEKLLHEIKAVLGDKTTATYEDLQKMTLVRNCIKETLR